VTHNGVIPTDVGIHRGPGAPRGPWAPAFAGVTVRFPVLGQRPFSRSNNASVAALWFIV